jgi:hypothetical protein
MKLKQKVKEEIKVGERVGARSYSDLMELALMKQLESKDLNEKEVAVLIDCCEEAQAQAKSLTEKVSAGKVVLLDYAKQQGYHDLRGELAVAKIGDKTEYELSASKAIKILEKEGKLKLLDDILTVRVTEFRKYLGSDLFEEKATKEEKTFTSISLKKK